VTSIRRRLLLSLFGLWIIVWAAVALTTLDRSGHEVGELMDAQMAQLAHVLREISLTDPQPAANATPQALSAVNHPYETKLSYQRWQGDRLVASFGGAPATPLAATIGFSDQAFGGARWRVFGLPGNAPDEVLFVAQSYTIREELIHFLTIQALKPILWSLPVSVLLMWLAVGEGLRPLHRLARSIGRRSAERLEPIDGDGVPTEIRPLTTALNALMERLDQALAAERRFAADASHELRTPFAIIHTYAQIARRSGDPAERQAALDNLIRGVDRASRLISQLLMLARLQGELRATGRGVASLVRAAARVVADRQADAQAAALTLTAAAADGVPGVVAVPAAALSILIGNLVENGLKYTPPGGWVQVAIGSGRGTVALRVTDSGPGIPAADRERVFDRFYRPPGQTQPGSGLGLAIVRRICDLYGLRIEIRDGADGVGLSVLVIFPEPSSSPKAHPP
jgi:signal transduction histidine kinase